MQRLIRIDQLLSPLAWAIEKEIIDQAPKEERFLYAMAHRGLGFLNDLSEQLEAAKNGNLAWKLAKKEHLDAYEMEPSFLRADFLHEVINKDETTSHYMWESDLAKIIDKVVVERASKIFDGSGEIYELGRDQFVASSMILRHLFAQATDYRQMAENQELVQFEQSFFLLRDRDFNPSASDQEVPVINWPLTPNRPFSEGILTQPVYSSPNTEEPRFY